MNSKQRWVVGVGVAGTVFIAAGAFWLSFAALERLAIKAGIDPTQAWAWPLIVDGLIVAATVAVVALTGQRSRWYAWLLLAGAALVSVSANALQAVMPDSDSVPPVVAAIVASVPPLVLLAVTHLTVILIKRDPQAHVAVMGEPSTPTTPQGFLLDYLAAHEGVALARDVIAAAETAGFSANQIKTARLRCTDPQVSSTKDAMHGGWLWTIQNADAAEGAD
ncbi:MAG: DUF2637 domain-containing protein [Propionibacteriaceae bacterium]|nr:DUF2637 domain-containing protein [Propionibacteriaceae bacterium]